MSNLLPEIETIFKDLFDEEEIQLTEETTANDIDDWDSIMHIQLLVAIEKHFKVKFTASEIYQFKNVGEIVRCVGEKQA